MGRICHGRSKVERKNQNDGLIHKGSNHSQNCKHLIQTHHINDQKIDK